MRQFLLYEPLVHRLLLEVMRVRTQLSRLQSREAQLSPGGLRPRPHNLRSTKMLGFRAAQKKPKRQSLLVVVVESRLQAVRLQAAPVGAEHDRQQIACKRYLQSQASARLRRRISQRRARQQQPAPTAWTLLHSPHTFLDARLRRGCLSSGSHPTATWWFGSSTVRFSSNAQHHVRHSDKRLRK